MTISDLNLNTVLGNRAARYLPRFQALLDKTGGDLVAAEKARGWNWGAFLAGPFWLIYHRAYAMGAAVIGVILVLAYFDFGASGLAVGAVLAVGGDALLLRFVRSQSIKRAALPNDAARAAFDRWHTGSSLPLALTALVVFLLAFLIADPETRSELAKIRTAGASSSIAFSSPKDLPSALDVGEAACAQEDAQGFIAHRLEQDLQSTENIAAFGRETRFKIASIRQTTSKPNLLGCQLEVEMSLNPQTIGGALALTSGPGGQPAPGVSPPDADGVRWYKTPVFVRIWKTLDGRVMIQTTW
jgi:hypothetical protein